MTNEDILHWLERIAEVLHENASYLTQLDLLLGMQIMVPTWIEASRRYALNFQRWPGPTLQPN